MSIPSTVTDAARADKRASSALSRFRKGNELTYGITLLCAFSIVAITALLFYELFANSALARQKFGFDFLFTSTWDPVSGQFGALPFIYGTVVTSAFALLLAVPFGVGAAIFLAELAPPAISDALTFLIELLAAVPSVIFGLLAIFVLVPALRIVEPAIRSVLGFLPFFKARFTE